jgi:hypothetical protein
MQPLEATSFSQFLAAHLSGAVVQQVKCGPGTGSIFDLHVLQQLQTHYLMVFCSWKLLQRDQITCSWKDSESFLQQQLSALQGCRVAHVQVLPGGDVRIDLNGPWQLLLYSDSAVPEDTALESDYFLQVGTTLYTCLRGQFYVEHTAAE